MRQMRQNLISAILIVCLTVTGISVTAFSGVGVYAEDEIAPSSISNCTITVPSPVVSGIPFSFNLQGDRQNSKGGIEGETRIIPYSYTIKHSGNTVKSAAGIKPDASGLYSYTTTLNKPAKAYFEVTWMQQKYEGKKWVELSKSTTKKTATVKGTLKFNKNGGTLSTTSKYLAHNTKAGSLPKPKKTGYKFKGWYTKKKKGKKITSSTKIKFSGSTKTVYARWTKLKNSYKVTLNPNGGRTSPKTIIVVKNKKYGKLAKLPTPTRTNYNFVGWYSKKTGGKKITNSKKVTKSSKHSIYARWKNKYTVTFNPNGGNLASSKKTKSVTLGKGYGSLPTPTRNNYTFAGWYTSQIGGINITSTTIVSLSKNQTLYARWQSSGGIISSYDSTAQTLVARIGKQGKSQCSVYSMSYVKAIVDKVQISPLTYWGPYGASWSTGGMAKTVHSSKASSASHPAAMAQIKRQIDKGRPCIIRTTYSSGQHWVTVVGYVPNASTYSDLYILDPAVTDPATVRLLKNTIYYYPTSGEVSVVTY